MSKVSPAQEELPHSLNAGWSGLASSRPVSAAAFGWDGGREIWERVQELRAKQDYRSLNLCQRENAKEPLVQVWPHPLTPPPPFVRLPGR